MKENKKYKLILNDTINVEGRTLYRIKALKDFGDVKAGDLGGYIEKEDNLSHDGNAWVYDNARVYGNAKVYDNAQVYGNAWVCGNAKVYGDAWVYDNARVYGNAQVYGNAWVSRNAWVFENAKVYGDAIICSNAYISSNDYAYIHGFGSENRTTTFFRTKDGSIDVKCGCFSGTLDEFRNEVKETHGDNYYAKEYLAIADLMEMRFNREEK